MTTEIVLQPSMIIHAFCFIQEGIGVGSTIWKECQEGDICLQSSCLMLMQASHGNSQQQSSDAMELMRKQLLEQQNQVQRSEPLS